MPVDLSTQSLLHSRLTAWNATNLTRWLDAVYAGDSAGEDAVEKDLLDLAKRIHLRVELLAGMKERRGLFESLHEDHYSQFEELVADMNKCLRDIVSLRPTGVFCPVRRQVADSIRILRSFGGIREEEWGPVEQI